MLYRNSSIIDSIFAADQVLRDQGTIGPGKHMIMQGIHLAKGGAHLTHLGDKALGQRGKGDKALLQIHACFSK